MNITKSQKQEVIEYMENQMMNNNIYVDFPEEIEKLTKNDLFNQKCNNRKDLRYLPTLTIDSDHTQDMDDAVSIEKTAEGYKLAVHIADVANFVEPFSPLFNEAAKRATSVYLPGVTARMLPDILSTDVCSLNPNADRDAISVVMELDTTAHIVSYEITKSLIRSRVKGVYDEVNMILDHKETKAIADKYNGLDLFVMKELAEKLLKNRIANGADVQDNSRSDIVFVNDSVIVTPHKRGISERIIEEFMILANHCVSKYMADKQLTAIYRTQANGKTMAEYKLATKENYRNHSDEYKHHNLAFSDFEYVHFTSPIRRISDLLNASILSMNLSGVSNEDIFKVFDEETMLELCDNATKKSRMAKQVQETVEAKCYSLYFSWRKFEFFSGMVTGYNRNNQPVITLDDYNIKVIGQAALHGYIGKNVKMYIDADVKNRRLYAQNVRVIA